MLTEQGRKMKRTQFVKKENVSSLVGQPIRTGGVIFQTNLQLERNDTVEEERGGVGRTRRSTVGQHILRRASPEKLFKAIISRGDITTTKTENTAMRLCLEKSVLKHEIYNSGK